jgi:glycerol-3-phosphate acyltransferase PlsY
LVFFGEGFSLRKKLGAATLASDILKSAFVVWLAQMFLETDAQAALVALAAVLGHCFPIYLKFKGGKGVATALGSVLMLSPISGAIAVAIWLVVYKLSKLSSMSALVASASIPAMMYFNVSPQVALVYILMVALIIMRHSENIERIRAGKELPATKQS